MKLKSSMLYFHRNIYTTIYFNLRLNIHNLSHYISLDYTVQICCSFFILKIDVISLLIFILFQSHIYDISLRCDYSTFLTVWCKNLLKYNSDLLETISATLQCNINCLTICLFQNIQYKVSFHEGKHLYIPNC